MRCNRGICRVFLKVKSNKVSLFQLTLTFIALMCCCYTCDCHNKNPLKTRGDCRPCGVTKHMFYLISTGFLITAIWSIRSDQPVWHFAGKAWQMRSGGTFVHPPQKAKKAWITYSYIYCADTVQPIVQPWA